MVASGSDITANNKYDCYPDSLCVNTLLNCTTGIVNRTHQLTMQDINYFYDKEFPRSGH